VESSRLTQLREVVTLDAILCPPIVDEILPQDWPHIVNEDFMLTYFTDLDYLLRRIGTERDRNLLCLYRNPEAHPSPSDSRFGFEGYDVVDVQGGISALTNCGGFPLAFVNEELNSVGLLPTRERATQVRTALLTNYPVEPHAHCDAWAIFRYRMST
jgi:hypothetical protein